MLHCNIPEHPLPEKSPMSDVPPILIMTPTALVWVPGVPEDSKPRRGLLRETLDYFVKWAGGRLRALGSRLPGPVLAPLPVPIRRSMPGR
jgi:hypothetical protein